MANRLVGQLLFCRAFWVTAALVGGALALTGGQLSRQVFGPGPDHPAIDYYGETSDPVSRLAQRIRSGTSSLSSGRTGGLGHLEAVLEALDVPVNSQVAVFARNSLQKSHIRPANPRLIYFNDSVLVAAIRGAPLIEIAVVDREKGVIFYTIEQSGGAPIPVRQNSNCLVCHDSLNSQGIPGLLLRSIPPSPDGSANPHLANNLVNHRTPFAERWAGWYVTGQHAFPHLGNGVATDMNDLDSLFNNQRVVMDSLEGVVPESASLVPTSDVVALMVLDHQVDMTNLLIRYGWEVRYQLAGGIANDGIDLRLALEEIVDYMFFTGEPAVESAVSGTSGFRVEFEGRGPTDSGGRSLRQFDLETRMMRHPLSYMIYSDAFTGLPLEARNAIYERIRDVLAGEGGDDRFAHLAVGDRVAIAGILRDTKNDLPQSFRQLQIEEGY